MKASSSITITNLTDGITTFYQYAKNTSNTSPPTTGWSAVVPPSEPNKFIWRREASAISLEDIAEWGNVVCLTGSTGAKGADGVSYRTKVQFALGTAEAPYRGDIISGDGLVAWYPLNDDTLDYSGSDAHGVASGGAVAVSGLNAGAYSFNGGASKIESNPNIVHNGKLTISLWVKANSKKNYGRMVDKSTGTSGNNGFDIAYSSGQGLGSWMVEVNGSTHYGSPNIFGVGTYKHCVFVIDGKNWAIYFDGVLDKTIVSNALPNPLTDNPLAIGNRSNAIDRGFDGLIQDVRIYNRVLSPEEITTIYENQGHFEFDGWSDWQETPPTPAAGEYVWRREATYLPPSEPTDWTVTRLTGDKGATGEKGDTGAKGATGDIGPRGIEGTSITGVTEYYLATTASSGVTTDTAGWATTLQPMTATKKYLWNYEKIHFSEGADQPTIPVIIGVYGDKGVTGDTGRAITSIQEKYLVSPNATGIARAGNTWHDTPPATTTTNKYLWNYEIINWSTGTTPTYVEPFVIGVHGATGPKGDQGLIGPQGGVGPVGQGIDSITEQYAISTSKTTPPAEGSTDWKDVAPTWSTGKYLWTRSKIVYKNPTDTKYTTPVCDTSWEAVNEIQIGGRNLLLDSEYHNNTSSTYLGTTVTFVNDTQYDTGTNYRLRINIPSSIKEGEEFVFSFAFNRTYSVHEIIVATPSKTYTFMSTVDDVGVFKRYSFNFIKGTDTYIEIYTTATTANWTLNSKEYKLEKGNKATDWTPAPEDLEGIVDKSVKTSDVEYYLSTSSTALSGGSWLTTAPKWVDGKFMWTRTKTTLNDGTVSYSPSEGGTCIAGAKGATGPKGDKGDTGDIGPEGPQGPMGNPGQLGLYADGTTLYLKGFADDGTLTAESGNIYGDGQRLVVPAYSQSLTAEGQGYVVFDGSAVQFAKLVADGTSKRWIPYNGGDSIEEDFWVIGSFTKDDSAIYNLQMVFPERSQQFERSHFMDILASGDMQNITKWAEANGVTQVFEKIAVLEAFINKVFANKIEISNNGAIYSRYTENGTAPSDGSGYYLSSDGLFQAMNAKLIGTLRTGLNAPTTARVAIQDESGIISGPTFTGSGLNDLTITKEGDVAGDFRVKISGINNATDSGKEGYWATPFQVGIYYLNAIAVNSSGRFVAVGEYGYIYYSDDGITWTPFQVGTDWWYGIAVNSAGRFVAIGDYGYITYSDDGITWATPFKVGTYYWNAIAVNSSGRFVAVGDYGYITYSDDGITWATPFKVGTFWHAIAVNSSGRFVAVGSNYISYSDDGITWATPFQVGTYPWNAIAVNSSGRFVAGGNGNISYSDDGITWTPFQVGSEPWNAIAVNSSGRFVAVGRHGYITYSDDGITWATPFQVGTHWWNAIAVNSSGRFVAVGRYGNITMSLLQDIIQISSNGGTTWGSDIPIPANEAISITGFGIDISFSNFRGHTVGDYWSFTQGAMRGLAITDSAGDEYLSASNGEVTLKTLNAPTVNATTVNATTVNATEVYGARAN